GERTELVHHRVDGFLQLQNLTLYTDGDLLGQIAPGDGRSHLGDVAHLGGEVAGHAVDVVGQILPYARHARDRRLAPQLALGPDFAGDARHLRGKGGELVHHGVDGFFQLEDFALDVDGDLLGEVAVGHRRRHLRDVAHLSRKIGGHAVNAIGQVAPG